MVHMVHQDSVHLQRNFRKSVIPSAILYMCDHLPDSTISAHVFCRAFLLGAQPTLTALPGSLFLAQMQQPDLPSKDMVSMPRSLVVSFKMCPLLAPSMPSFSASAYQLMCVSAGQALSRSVFVDTSQVQLLSDGERDFYLPHCLVFSR